MYTARGAVLLLGYHGRMPELVDLQAVIADRVECLRLLAEHGDSHASKAADHLEAFRDLVVARDDATIGFATIAVVEPLIESLLDAKVG
jgi:hypothetical protein